ncbi:Sodium/hydrogen exchanger 9B2 [Homalodisca vitripennis]|nr:Sodium/hydrogen exchanger 9B2 [Homalodisca vitripennis]
MARTRNYLENVLVFIECHGTFQIHQNAHKAESGGCTWQLATTVGMVRAGGRLVPDAIYVALHCHQSLRICGLGMVPSFLEAMVTAVISYLALAYPPIWALCLGFLLCPNSPAVITPPMEELMAMGYGEGKHVGVLVRGAAGLDVAFSVSLFDICLALLFHFRCEDVFYCLSW